MLLPYVAGLFDGEGCVHLQGRPRHKLGLRVTLANTNSDVITQLQKEFGGGIDCLEGLGNHKDIYNWRVAGIQATKFLSLIIDYLIIKKPITELALAAMVLKQYDELDEEMAQKIIKVARHLNHRGK